MEIWIVTAVEPEREPARYYQSEEDAHNAMHEAVDGLRGEWQERLTGGVVEWGFYELDEQGQLLSVKAWEIEEEELQLVQT